MGKLNSANILIVGAGGREHALAWALKRSSRVGQIYAAPGNAGTEATAHNIPLRAEDTRALVNFARERHIDLTVVGPEVPLAAGIVDAFQAAGLRIFGPTQAAAQLEASKAFSKDFMQRHHIPTAAYATFTSYAAAREYISQSDRPLVVKADGLAAGKGVLMCESHEQAEAALKQIMLDSAFGTAGQQVVIEEWLTGTELSVLAFSDGHTVSVMPPARDHKRIYDHDEGPNTGGMGAYAPAPEATPELIEQIRREILQPVIDGMAAEGMPYVGVLYAGLMLTPAGVKVLEFNCRFGDPETQVILPLLEGDLLEILLACVEGRLGEIEIQWKPGVCATVVLAAPGYPDDYPKGLFISGLDKAARHENVIIFHAGTGRIDYQYVTAGGRVLAVSATGATLDAALYTSYAAVRDIHFEGMHYRRDIGKR